MSHKVFTQLGTLSISFIIGMNSITYGNTASGDSSRSSVNSSEHSRLYPGTLDKGSFKLTPISTHPENEALIKQGLIELYSANECSDQVLKEKQISFDQCLPQKKLSALVSKAEAFDRETRNIMNKFIHENNGRLEFDVELMSDVDKNQKSNSSLLVMLQNFFSDLKNELKALFTLDGHVFNYKLTMKSPIQRTNNHPANNLVANFVVPKYPTNCDPLKDWNYASILMIHHVLDDVPAIVELGKFYALLENLPGNGLASMVITLPHYGNRKIEGDNFFTLDEAAFKQNIQQAILDIHILRDWLMDKGNHPLIKLVNKNHIALSGLSLGGVLALLAGTYDPGYPSGMIPIVGGSDMVNILMNRVRTRENSEVQQALKISNDEKTRFNDQNTAFNFESELREKFAPYDSLTWSYHHDKSPVKFISATNDDIMDKHRNVDPVYKILGEKLNNTEKVSRREDEGAHTPQGTGFNGIKEKIGRILLPVIRFVKGDDYSAHSVHRCESDTN